MRKKIYAIVSAACLLVSIGLIIAMSKTPTPLSKAYTLRSHVEEIDNAGNITSSHDEMRYVSTSGNWRSIKIYPDGRQMPDLIGDYKRQSVFAVQGNKLVFMSEYHGKPNLTRERLFQSGRAIGTEYLLGYETIIVRDGALTQYFAPDLDWEILKVEFQDPNGSRMVIEPVSIEMGEPGAKALGYPENLPINREFFDSRHNSQPAH